MNRRSALSPACHCGGQRTWDSPIDRSRTARSATFSSLVSVKQTGRPHRPTPRSRSVADSAIQKENREQKRMNPAAEFTWRVSGGIAIPPKFESGPPRDHHRPRSDQDSKYRGNNKTRQAEAWTGKLNRSWQTGQWTAASRSSKSAK